MDVIQTDVLIEAQNIGCIFGQNPEKNNAKLLSPNTGIWVDKLLIPKVGITVITGKSGSGKSTLLGLLSRIRAENCDHPSRKLSLNSQEKEISLLEFPDAIKGKMGFVFQEAHLIKNITVEANAELACRAIGHNISSDAIRHLAKTFSIDDLWTKSAKTLSGGQAQRLAVIRALAVNPDILICDEPTSSLDDETASLLLETLKDWSEANQKAVLWVTHNVAQAAEFSDYLIRVEDGTVDVTKNGLPHDLRSLSKEQKHEIISKNKKVPINTNRSHFEISNHSEQLSEPSCKNGRHNTRFWNFILKLSFLDIYSPKTELQHRKHGPLTANSDPEIPSDASSLQFSNPPVRTAIFAPFLKGLTWVYLLGLVVISMLSICWFTGQNYLNDKLTAPEVTHFTLTSYSSLDLSYKNIQKFNKFLRPLTGSKAAHVYGRRELPLMDIFWSTNGACAKPPRKERIRIPILIFQQKEPLFVKSFGANASAKNTIFVTRDIEASLPQKADSASNFSELCVNIYGKYFPFTLVRTQNAAMPGSLDQTYFAAINDKNYRSLALSVDRSRFQKEDFNRLSIYFDRSNSKKILCSFGALDAEDECKNPAIDVYSKLKINKDVFKTLGSLTILSTTASIVFALLLSGFLCILSISTALAVGDYIKSNQKSLAILKGFGANKRFLTALIFSNSLILQLNALFVLIALFVSTVAFAQYLLPATPQLQQYLDLEIKNVVISGGIVFTISSTVILGLVLNWIRRNKYVAETLQQV